MNERNEQQIVQSKSELSGENPAPERNRYADMMNKSHKKLPKSVKTGIAVLLIASLMGGGVYLVKRTRTTSQSQETTVAYATRGMLETYIEGDGSVSARKQAELGKDLKGKVTNVFVQTGQTVKAGDPLFSVDPADLRKELETAQKDLQESQRALDEASSSVTAAQKNVAELTTTAPFSGKFIPTSATEEQASKTYRVGDEVSGGTTLGTFVDDSILRVSLYFSYAYLDSITPGAPATVSIPSTMSSVPGWVDSVDRVEKISSSGTKMFRVVVALNNPGTLTKDMVASATIPSVNGDILPAESGKLEYNREETITLKQSGEITRIATLDYARFSAGAVLVQQQSEELVRAVETAQRTLASQQQMIADKQKRIQELNTQIAGANVVSPIDGVVLRMDTAVEAELVGGTAPCVIADMSSLVVNAQISMNDVNSVAAGQFAAITVHTGAEELALTGQVESVSLMANETSGSGSLPTYTAVIVLDPLPEGVGVSMGYYVSYKITTAQVDDCITIPSSALVNTIDGTAVFAKPAEGETFENTIPIPEGTEGIPEGFVLVPVEVGLSDSSNIEIISGIEDGTEVFLAGPQDMFSNVGVG